MAEIIYHLFNIVATYLFEGFSYENFLWLFLWLYKHFTCKINQKLITQATNVIMCW